VTASFLERVVVYGVSVPPSSVKGDGKVLEFVYDKDTQVLMVRKPSMPMDKEWTLTFL